MPNRAEDSPLSGFRQRIESALERALAIDDPPAARLIEAMRYSVLGGGKRLRALLVYCAGSTCGAHPARLDAPAVAVELIHAYSLIHDDLPAMDDDDLRRGRPTCHRAFDEGTAILAGDALQALAFEVLAARAGGVSAGVAVAQLSTLAVAIGTAGMAGGQAIDLAAAGQSLSLPALEAMHRRKTGALIKASVLMGAIAADVGDPALSAALASYGDAIGLAFQIQDDILDVVGETARLGKQAGADLSLNKPTYPSMLGLARARELAAQQRDAALAAIEPLGRPAHALAELAWFVVARDS